MIRSLTALALASLLVFSILTLSRDARAQSDLVIRLLSLPAPPPPNPFERPPSESRPDSFFDQKNPPPDDAPIEDLIDYWKAQSKINPAYNYAIFPSETVARRLLAAIETDPAKNIELVPALAGNADATEAIRRIYEEQPSKIDPETRYNFGRWLKFNSPAYAKQLLPAAESVRDEREYLTNQDELRALARLDWELAEPIVQRLLNDSNQPISQTLARWVYYERAIATNDQLGISRWREELKRVVEDKSAVLGSRDLAMDAIVEAGDFEGRDDWYMTMLADETFQDLIIDGRSFTGLTTIINHSPKGAYDDRMIELLRTSNSKTVRSAAIRNLVNSGAIEREEVVRLLIPWLEDPKWANDVQGSRLALVKALGKVKAPESVAGLMSFLREVQEIVRTAGTRFPNVPVSAIRRSSESFYQTIAAALGNQGDPRAAVPLRELLPESSDISRSAIIKALFDCRGFSVTEQIDAIEKRARIAAAELSDEEFAERRKPVPPIITDDDVESVQTEPPQDENAPPEWDSVSELRVIGRGDGYGMGGGEIYNPSKRKPFDMAEVYEALGKILENPVEPADDVVRAMIERIAALERTEPKTASKLADILRTWRGPAVNAVAMRKIKDGKAELADVISLLIRRAEIRDRQSEDIGDMSAGVPFALGFAPCLLGENGAYDAMLDGGSVEAKTAMLACARMIRAKLPVERVAELLRSEDKTLAIAARRYLASNDSPEARSAILAADPDKAVVLGSRAAFDTDGTVDDEVLELFKAVNPWVAGIDAYGADYSRLKARERKLRAEVIANPELAGIYAYDKYTVRIFRDSAVFSWEEDPARFRERVLEREEFERLTGFIAESRIEEMPPFLANCEGDCDGIELLMLGRAGGRRVFTIAQPTPAPFKALDEIFTDFKAKPGKLRYYAESEISGLEVIFENDEQRALTVWKNGDDLRIFLMDVKVRKEIDKDTEAVEGEYDEEEPETVSPAELKKRAAEEAADADKGFGWFRFGNGQVIAEAARPAGFSLLPDRDGLAVNASRSQWKSRGKGFEIRTSDEGLFKIVGPRITKMRTGNFGPAVVTPDGRWVVVRRSTTDAEAETESFETKLVRFDLLTGREFPIEIESERLRAIAFVPGQNKILLGQTYEIADDDLQSEIPLGKMFWLDPVTGAIEPATGTVEPLAQQSFRPLQLSVIRPNEYWAAIPRRRKGGTEIGLFNDRTLKFQVVATIPKIIFDSMRMWVDEPGRKAYFAYEGHLLSVPLK